MSGDSGGNSDGSLTNGAYRAVISDAVWHSRNTIFQASLRQLWKFARQGTIPILIEGHTGTGKTRMAREIHLASPRHLKPFREVTLSSIEDSLSGSELFGHVAGAFTDARQTRTGAFLSAAGGTLFLDEIGKASDRVQMKLLGAVETGVIVQQGSDRSMRVDARIVSATNIPMERLVHEGRFLPDLAARLSMFRVTIPPLRERREDIADIANGLLSHRATEFGFARAPLFDPVLLRAIERADWPLNVRQLDAAIQLLLLEAAEDRSKIINLKHCVGDLEFLIPLADLRKRQRPTARQVREEFHATESRSDLAKRLGISESTLHRRLRKSD